MEAKEQRATVDTIYCLKKVIHHKSKKKANKGTWRMPWLSKAKKDVISCEKLRGVANTH